MSVRVETCSAANIDFLLRHLRPADAAEMRHRGLRGKALRARLDECVEAGCVAAVVDGGGRTILVFGWVPDTGYVWALGTVFANGMRRAFVELSHAILGHVRTLCTRRLWTRAWLGNPVHLRWLRWCGFEPSAGDPEIFVRTDHV